MTLTALLVAAFFFLALVFRAEKAFMSTDAQPVASSATPDAPIAQTPADEAVAKGDQAAFKEARRAERSGKTPASIAAESTPAEPGDQAASTEVVAPPASEPGTPAPKKNAESRKQELNAEIQALLAQRAQLRAELEAQPRQPQRQDAPAAPSAVPVGEKFPDYDTWITAQPAEAQSYEDYIDARAAHVYEQRQHAERTRTEQETAEREERTRLDTYRQSAAKFVAEHADYWDVIKPITDTPPSETAGAIGDVITRASNPPQLLYHLGQHLDEFARLLTLPPTMAVYELGQLAGSLTAPASTPIPQQSRAPAPPTTLGRRAVEPADQLESIVASGDMVRFKALRQRERLAQQGR
jgi:hypothetical protein